MVPHMVISPIAFSQAAPARRAAASLTAPRGPQRAEACPASVTLSRTAALPITAPALPRPPRPWETGRATGGRRDMHAQLSRERQAAHGPASAALVRGPSVVAGPRPCKADGPARRSWPSQPPADQHGRATRRDFRAAAVRYASVGAGFRGPCGPRTEAKRATDEGGKGHGRGRWER